MGTIECMARTTVERHLRDIPTTPWRSTVLWYFNMPGVCSNLQFTGRQKIQVERHVRCYKVKK